MRLHFDDFRGINPAKHEVKKSTAFSVRAVNVYLERNTLQGLQMPTRFADVEPDTVSIQSLPDGEILTSTSPRFGAVQETARQSHLTYMTGGEVIGDSGTIKATVTKPDGLSLTLGEIDVTKRRYETTGAKLGAVWQQYESRQLDSRYQNIDIIHMHDTEGMSIPDELKKHQQPPEFPVAGDTDQGKYYDFDAYTHAEIYPNFTPCAYVITYIDMYGRESKPSRPVVSLNPKEADKPHTLVFPHTSDQTIQGIRVYRAVANAHSRDNPVAGQSVFLPIRELPITTDAWTVDVPLDVQGSVPLESHYYDDPPQHLYYLTETESGMLVCADDNLNAVRLSLRHQWHGWQRRRTINLQKGAEVYDIVTIEDIIYMLTNIGVYVAAIAQESGVGGVRIEVRKVDTPAPPLPHVRAIKSDYGCLYLSDQGLVAVNKGNVRMLTENLITADQWRQDTYRGLAFYRGRIYIFRSQDTAVINLPDQVFGGTVQGVMKTVDFVADASSVTDTGKFILLSQGGLYEWSPDTVDNDQNWFYESEHIFTRDRVQITALRATGTFEGEIKIYTDGILLDTCFKPGDVTNFITRTYRGWVEEKLHFTLDGKGELYAFSLGSDISEVSLHTQG